MVVRDGTYTGSGNVNLDFHGKAITVRSENGPDNCVIDCENVGDTRGLYFHSREGADSVVDGFAIRNGKAAKGGGIYCYISSPTITNNVVTGNSAEYGGGIHCSGSSPTIANNVITGNSAGGIGGGIYCYSSSPTITNTILWDNVGGEVSGTPGTITYSDVKGGWAGDSNINADPLFADAASGDYHLLDSSPCIGAGTRVGAPSTDIEGHQRPDPPGSDPDMGAYENKRGVPLPPLDGALIVEVFCPVDLEVTDPQGRTVTKDDTSAIPSVTYIEMDLDGDGDTDDRVIIPDALFGGYSIRVIPEPGAADTDCYTLDFCHSGESVRVAENVQVQDIPAQSYGCFFPQCDVEPGWNLISVPVQLPGSSLDVALQSIAGYYSSVWTYDATESEWERYIVNGPSFLNNLETVEPGKGYWVQMTEPAALSLDGDVVPDETILLKQGWNLVGYNSLTAKPLEDALSSIAANCVSVWTYDATDGEWRRYIQNGPEFLNNLETMEPGKGYWINAADDCGWDVNGTTSPAPAFPSSAPDFGRGDVSTDRPVVPYTIWGSVEANGAMMTGSGAACRAPTVLLKAADEAQYGYRLGIAGQYGDFYVLDVPKISDSSEQAVLYVQIGDTWLRPLLCLRVHQAR